PADLRSGFRWRLWIGIEYLTRRRAERRRRAAEPPADLKDFRDLLGAWEVPAIEAAGKPGPAGRVRKIRVRYVFSDDKKVTISSPDRPDKTASFTVDATTNPKRLTVALSPPVRALYAVEGNQLRVCLMAEENPNAGYPRALASTASPKTDLLTLERR